MASWSARTPVTGRNTFWHSTKPDDKSRIGWNFRVCGTASTTSPAKSYYWHQGAPDLFLPFLWRAARLGIEEKLFSMDVNLRRASLLKVKTRQLWLATRTIRSSSLTFTQEQFWRAPR